MPYLDELTSQTLPVTLSIRDVEIPATYYPDRISGNDFKRMSSMRESLASNDAERVVDAINDSARFLANVLASWELDEYKGGPRVEISEARLVRFGATIVGYLLGSFLREMRLGEPTGNALPARSQRTAGSRSRKSSRRS